MEDIGYPLDVVELVEMYTQTPPHCSMVTIMELCPSLKLVEVTYKNTHWGSWFYNNSFMTRRRKEEEEDYFTQNQIVQKIFKKIHG